jgi:hypothetical protein
VGLAPGRLAPFAAKTFSTRSNRLLGRKSWILAPLGSISRWLLRKGLFQPETRLGHVVTQIHTPFDAFERASKEVATGNLKVFAEIGHQFARFIATVPVDAAADSPEFLEFAAGLRPGPPPDGQAYLREAFAHYQHQRQESDAGTRAAWILLANLKIGLHEQTRLQPQIAAAVDAPIATAEDLGARVLDVLIPSSRRWPHIASDPLAKVIGWLAGRIRRESVAVTREIVTQALMVLTIPLDSDGPYTALPLGAGLEAVVPPLLRVAHPFLDSFVKPYDPCPSGGTNCGATDWCDLRQRMHYIVPSVPRVCGNAVTVRVAVHTGASGELPGRHRARRRAWIALVRRGAILGPPPSTARHPPSSP